MRRSSRRSTRSLVAQRARGALVELELEPLPRAAIDDLVRQVATLDADARDQVVAAADGNPLLAVESARAAARGLERPAAEPARGRARRRRARCRDDARRVAELAAVAGRELGAPRARRARAARRRCSRAMDSGLFVSADGRFGFRHALLREAVVAELPDAAPRELHEELAGVLDGPAPPRSRATCGSPAATTRPRGRSPRAARRRASPSARSTRRPRT